MAIGQVVISASDPIGQWWGFEQGNRIITFRLIGTLPRSLSDLGVRREGKRDRNQNLCKFEANSELFNENLRGFWPISAFPQQNHPKSDRLLARPRPQPNLLPSLALGPGIPAGMTW
uniref:Uncharacterized protein n=1 Tax=Candidatus Kentrum sp. DK TaxID=2126562 RepID=A0A450RUF4_9GAMM|nr:MAG: hypothetical protein BECKDK2373B_GA0170837_10039 [Candidatus Kentron sp. DK]